MTTARDAILGRVRAALGPSPAVPDVPRAYNGPHPTPGDGPSGDVVARFAERCAEYRAEVRRVSAGELTDAIAEACRARGAQRIVTPPGGPSLPGFEMVVDDPPLSARDLDAVDAVLTGCALAIAETGTIVLDGGPRSGRRAITLVPDYHVCVVEASSIVAGVPDAVAALADAAA